MQAILWDISSSSALHKFSLYGGFVTRFLVPFVPGGGGIDGALSTFPRVSQSVVAVASDGTAGVLNLRDHRCTLLAPPSSSIALPIVSRMWGAAGAGAMAAEVEAVRWRLPEGLLLIYYSDGVLAVWDAESGALERTLVGPGARDAFDAADFYTVQIEQHTLTPQTGVFIGALIGSINVSIKNSCSDFKIF